MTLPDCEFPAGLVGVNRAATSVSCSPPDALVIVYPAGCGSPVVNCRVPACPFPLHVPPVICTASAVPVPDTYTKYCGSAPLTPAGRDDRLTVFGPAVLRS